MGIQCEMGASIGGLLPGLSVGQRRCSDLPQCCQRYCRLFTREGELVFQRSSVDNKVDGARVVVWKLRSCFLYEHSNRQIHFLTPV